MAEPNTGNKLLIVPVTGDLPGTWGSAAVNPDFAAIDGMLGGSQTISLSNANVVLTVPGGTLASGAGPTQSQNAGITLTGTLTGNVNVTFTLPGFYTVFNLCTGNFTVTAVPAAGGNNIGLPPGRRIWIFYDGTDMTFVNMPDVGSYMDLATTAPPSWIAACTVAPWLLCNGAVYSTSIATTLGTMLGSAFGGNGITTFGVPDLQGRLRIPLDGTGSRITAAVSGINGTTFGAAGGDQNPQAHNHTYTDPGHSHTVPIQPNENVQIGPNNYGVVSPSGANNPTTSSSQIGITINTTFVGASGNVQPSLIAGITLIKT